MKTTTVLGVVGFLALVACGGPADGQPGSTDDSNQGPMGPNGNGLGSSQGTVTFGDSTSFGRFDFRADVNGDGVFDLVGKDWSVRLADGHGGFAPKMVDGLVRPGEIGSVGDVNGDGRADAMSCTNGTCVLALAKSDGTFGQASTLTRPKAPVSPYDASIGGAHIDDADGDKNADVLWAVMTSSGYVLDSWLVSAVAGDGTVTNTSQRLYRVPPRKCDFDGDGLRDAMDDTGNAVMESVSVSTKQRSQVLLQVKTAYDIAKAGCGDVDGDGKNDVIIVRQDTRGEMDPALRHGPEVDVFKGYGDGTFDPPIALPRDSDVSDFIAVADVAGLGRDQVAIETATGEHVLLTIDRDLKSATAQPLPSRWGKYADYSFPDVNGDSKPDLVVVDQGLFIALQR